MEIEASRFEVLSRVCLHSKKGSLPRARNSALPTLRIRSANPRSKLRDDMQPRVARRLVDHTDAVYGWWQGSDSAQGEANNSVIEQGQKSAIGNKWLPGTIFHALATDGYCSQSSVQRSKVWSGPLFTGIMAIKLLPREGDWRGRWTGTITQPL